LPLPIIPHRFKPDSPVRHPFGGQWETLLDFARQFWQIIYYQGRDVSQYTRAGIQGIAVFLGGKLIDWLCAD